MKHKTGKNDGGLLSEMTSKIARKVKQREASKRWRRTPPVRLTRTPPIITPQQMTKGGTIQLNDMTTRNLYLPNNPIIRVGSVYYDSNRFIREHHPAFKVNERQVWSFKPTGVWT